MMFGLLGREDQFNGTEITTPFMDVRQSNINALGIDQAGGRTQGLAIAGDYFVAPQSPNGSPFEYVAFYDTDGVLQDTRSYPLQVGSGTNLEIWAVTSDGTDLYFFGKYSTQQFVIFCTSSDGTTIRWSRRLAISQLNPISKRNVCLCVNQSHVYFSVEGSNVSVQRCCIGQLSKETGVLNWIKLYGTTGGMAYATCDENYVVFVDTITQQAYVVLDSSGNLVARKKIAASSDTPIASFGVLGVKLSGGTLYLSGVYRVDPKYLLTLKITLDSGVVQSTKRYWIQDSDDNLNVNDGNPFFTNALDVDDNYIYVAVTRQDNPGDHSNLVYVLGKDTLNLANVFKLTKSGNDLQQPALICDGNQGFLLAGFRPASGSDYDNFLTGVKIGETLPTGWTELTNTVSESSPSISLSNNTSISFTNITPSNDSGNNTGNQTETDLTSTTW